MNWDFLRIRIEIREYKNIIREGKNIIREGKNRIREYKNEINNIVIWIKIIRRFIRDQILFGVKTRKYQGNLIRY